MTTTTTTPLPVGTWQLDPAHTHIGFELDYMGGIFRGTFSPVEGTLTVDEQGKAKLAGQANADAVKVQDENLNAHLLSPEFFDAQRTPILTFESQDIGVSGSEVRVNGELTIKGTTQPVELHGTITEPLTDAFGRERFGLKLQGTIDRTQFGLNWNIPLPNGEPSLSNEVRLVGELYVVKG
jgi:polyisoprenoid-binding protein YceI